MIRSDKCIVMDVDGTLCPVKRSGESYADLLPFAPMLARLRELSQEGWYVVLQTSRTMRTHEGNVGRINATTLPDLVDWLRSHDVPFDEIHVGKPWAGHDGFYVDDRAVRPGEFLDLDTTELQQLIERDRARLA